MFTADRVGIKLAPGAKVTVTEQGILVEGIDGDCASCREVAVLACMWAISRLQTETTKTIEQPGGGAIGLG